MKAILHLIISATLVASGYSQTRNVLVGTNNAVVQPTNFWSADASNARVGLGLGTAATNSASTFQPSSMVLSNLSSSNGAGLTNISVNGVVGALATNGNASGMTNFPSLLLRTNGNGSGITNITGANVVGSVALASNISGAIAISNVSNLQSSLDSKLSITGNASGLTNIQASSIVGIIPSSNISTVTLTNITGTLPIVQGGTGATNQAGARTALGVGASDVFVGLTNLGVGSNLGFSSLPYILGSTNSTAPNNAVLALNGVGVRSVAGLTLAALTNVDNASFRSAIGLGSAATNPSSAFQSASVVLSNLASSNGTSLTNILVTNVVGALATNGNGAGLTNLIAANISGTVARASNVTGTIAISNGGSGATTTGGARTNLGLGATNNVAFNSVYIGAGDLQFSNDSIFWAGSLRYSPEDQSFEGSIGINNGSIQFIGTNAAANIAATRTNLGLGWPALTNSNAGTGLVSVNTNGDVISPTNFWQRAPIQTTVQDFTGITVSQTNNATNARNVYVYSLATNVSGISNTIILPTNVSTFNGDDVTVVHKGTTNTTTVVRQAGSTNNLITLNKFDESVKFIRELGQWDFYHNISFVEPIQFSGTNASANAATSVTNLFTPNTPLVFTTNGQVVANTGTNVLTFTNFFKIGGDTVLSDGQISWGGGVVIDIEQQYLANGNWTVLGALLFNNTTNAAATRANLGLPLAALTNTNNANFQEAIFTTNAAPTNAGNFGDHVAWMGVSIVTNGVTNVFKIPLYK